MDIVLIAHGGAACGMGHVIRSSALASALQQQGCRVRFYSRYPEGRAYLQKNGFICTNWNPAEEQMPDCVIIDSYDVDYHFLFSCKSRTMTVYMDDLAAFDYPVDIILNGNITGSLMHYKQPGPYLLTGIEYNLIRTEFQNLPKRITKRKAQTICITTGASDPENAVCRILHAIQKEAGLQCYSYSVIIGPAFQNQEEILETASCMPYIQCFLQPENMAEIMQKADAAICAGGSTVYELASCGVPMLAFIYAENQRTVVEYMAANDLLTNLGSYRKLHDTDLTGRLQEILNNASFREKQTVKLQAVLDGRGADRAAEAIIAFYHRTRKGVFSS